MHLINRMKSKALVKYRLQLPFNNNSLAIGQWPFMHIVHTRKKRERPNKTQLNLITFLIQFVFNISLSLSLSSLSRRIRAVEQWTSERFLDGCFVAFTFLIYTCTETDGHEYNLIIMICRFNLFCQWDEAMHTFIARHRQLMLFRSVRWPCL